MHHSESQARDEQGRLLAVYHGANRWLYGKENAQAAGFTIFNKAVSWFSPSRELATLYANEIPEVGYNKLINKKIYHIKKGRSINLFTHIILPLSFKVALQLGHSFSFQKLV